MKPIKKSKFFSITPDLLGLEERSFPFTLYICEPSSGRHTPFLYANSPYSSSAQETLFELFDKGITLDIHIQEKDTFLTFLELEENDVPSLAIHITKWDILVEQRKDEFHEELCREFSLVDEFKRAILTNSFATIIQRARMEILQWPYDHSPTISNAIQIAEELLKKEDYNSRAIACCYHFARKLKYDSEEELAAIICGAAFKDIGTTQINPHILQHLSALNEREAENWAKHPALSVFMLKKLGIDLSDRVSRIILEHHERFNGKGFPRQKMADFIDPLAELLGFFDHFFKFIDGHINGRKATPLNTIRSILSEVHLEGLETNFSPSIKTLLESHLPNLPKEKMEEKKEGA